MAEDNTTRQRILRTAAGLFRRQGYHATGLSQVLTAGQAPKGCLYFHFPGGKEQLGAEAVTFVATQLGAALATIVDTESEPVVALSTIADGLGERLVTSGFHEGCPVATVALDAASDSETIRTACADAYGSWTAQLSTALGRWRVPRERRESLATVILSTFEGALLLARVRRSAEPLRAAAEQLGLLVTAAIGG